MMQRLQAIELGKTAVHWGWIPAIIYLGLSRTYPRPSLIKCVRALSAKGTQLISWCQAPESAGMILGNTGLSSDVKNPSFLYL